MPAYSGNPNLGWMSGGAGSSPPLRSTYTTSGSNDFLIPADITFVRARCWGAGGNSGSYGSGGAGGFADGTVAVTSGSTLKVEVGDADSRSGGDYSGVFQTSVSQANALVMGGGGGGSSGGHCGGGGAGGGGGGEHGQAGAGPLAGGAGTSSGSGSNSPYGGGSGSGFGNPTNNAGGGYYRGGGGGNVGGVGGSCCSYSNCGYPWYTGGGGGGGSGYVETSNGGTRHSWTTGTTGTSVGGSGDSLYQSPAGHGGPAGSGSGVDGMVVVEYGVW